MDRSTIEKDNNCKHEEQKRINDKERQRGIFIKQTVIMIGIVRNCVEYYDEDWLLNTKRIHDVQG